MADGLHKLVYLSYATTASEKAALAAQVEQILDVSRRNNGEAAITGALMYNQGCFAQVLEGELDAIEETFERIQMDERHDRVSILAFDKVEQRVFSNWSMGWVGEEISSGAVGDFATLADEVDLHARQTAGDRIYQLLRQHMLDAQVS